MKRLPRPASVSSQLGVKREADHHVLRAFFLMMIVTVEAERQGIEGAAKLRALVGKDGAVENVELVNGPSLLATAAVNAIRHWHFHRLCSAISR
jgi:hypothetical protein